MPIITFEYEETYVKPPLGIVPKFIKDAERLTEIQEAITRYMNVDAVIPIEWIQEHNELVINK